MRAHRWTRVLAAAVIATVCVASSEAAAQGVGVGRGRATAPGQLKKQATRDDYYRGYEQGNRDGEQDARRNRPYQSVRRNDSGDFRNGYVDGYRDGYYQVRGTIRNDRRQDGVFFPRDDRRDGGVIRRGPGGNQEPAFARGYSDGYEDGLSDGRDRHSYDPVAEKDYRSGDKGYYGSYGSRDAYKNNYRAGFRQGYEDGYRDGGNRRR
jgi:hypothetical protein